MFGPHLVMLRIFLALRVLRLLQQRTGPCTGATLGYSDHEVLGGKLRSTTCNALCYLLMIPGFIFPLMLEFEPRASKMQDKVFTTELYC